MHDKSGHPSENIIIQKYCFFWPNEKENTVQFIQNVQKKTKEIEAK